MSVTKNARMVMQAWHDYITEKRLQEPGIEMDFGGTARLHPQAYYVASNLHSAPELDPLHLIAGDEDAEVAIHGVSPFAGPQRLGEWYTNQLDLLYAECSASTDIYFYARIGNLHPDTETRWKHIAVYLPDDHSYGREWSSFHTPAAHHHTIPHPPERLETTIPWPLTDRTASLLAEGLWLGQERLKQQE